MNTFILRWNPAISSYRMEEHKINCKEIKLEPIFYNWSVREWQDLHAGDAFVLLQVGTDNDGIAMIGKFISEAYEEDSWRNDGTKIHYADMQIFYACDLNEKKSFRATHFEKTFPGIKWHGGHSGEKLSDQDSEKLISRIDFAMKNTYGFESTSFSDFLQNDNRFLPINAEKKKAELLSLLAPYNPVVHTGEEDDRDWLFDDEEFAIEIKNPAVDSYETSLCIAFADKGFTIYFAEWHEYFRMTEGDYERFLGILKSILENKVYVLRAFKELNDIDSAVTELLSADESRVKITYWDNTKSFDIHKGKTSHAHNHN